MPTATYSAGTAFLTVVPSFLGVEKAMEQQVRQMAGKVDKAVAAALPKGMAEGARAARGSGVRAAQVFTGAYEAEAKKRLVKAYQSLPEFEPDMPLRKWHKAVNQLRADMKEISESKFGPDFDENTFATAIEQMQRRAADLAKTTPKIGAGRGFFDLSAAEGEMGQLAGFVAQARLRGEEAADGFGGAFQRRMSEVLSKGVGAIPKVKIDADSSEAERKIQQLRTDMQSLSGKTIGLDISSDAAYDELRRIASELDRLDRRDVEVEVRTNARNASADMGAFIQQTDQASNAVTGIGNSANFSMTRLGYLIGIAASLGSVIVPGAAAAAAAIGAIGTSAIAAGAGLGVFALGLSGIPDAVKAMGAYEQDRTKSSNNLSQASRRVADSADGVRMAELSLANTRANIADQEFDAAQRVAEAQRSVADARRAATQRSEDGNRRVRDAQRDVTAAEEDAVEVRRALNAAIRDAAREIAELDTALARNKQEQSKATTGQLEALEKLRALQSNPRATEVELRKATDAYNEQTVRLKELRDERKRLTDDQTRAAKNGVEGDERVVAARKRIADADEKVSRARERRDLAEQQRSREREESARKIADAQRGVADARRAQDRQGRAAAYQLASATKAVTAAQQSAASSAAQMGEAGGAALEKMNEEMDKLSPAGQRFAKFIFGLRGEAKGLRDVAQENLLPGLEQAITNLLPYLPGFSRFIGNIAAALGRMAVQASRALETPVWQKFFRFVDTEAVPALYIMFESGMNVASGLASLLMALSPFNKDIGGGLVDMTADFARWADELDKKQGYQEFLEYVRENGPKVVHFLGEAGKLLVDLVRALAPLGSVVISGLGGLIDGINSIPIGVLSTFLGVLGAVAAGVVALGAVMKVVRFKRDMQDLFGPTQQRLIQTYAYETGRATKETGRFQTAVQTAAGFTQAQGKKLQFLETSALNARVGMGLLADTASTRLRQGLDAASTASGALGGRVKGMGENVKGARNYLSYLADDLVRGPMGPQFAAIGSAAQTAGQRIKGMGENVGAARGYLSKLGDDLARGPLGPQFAAAGDAAQRFGRGVRDVGTKSLSGMRVAAGGLSAFLGGPWGLALAGATVAIGTLAGASEKYNGKIETINSSLDELGQKYKELEEAGKLGGSEASNLLLEIANRNPEMQAAVINLDAMGIAVGDLGRAAAGSKGDVERILTALDQEIDAAGDKWRDESNFLFTVWSKDARNASARLEQLRQLREAVKKHAEETDHAAKVEGLFNEQSKRHIGMAAILKSNTHASTREIAAMATAWDTNEMRLAELNETLGNFGSDAESAVRRANDLTKAIERQYGATMNANEASERWSENVIRLRESVAANGHTLDINTRAGLNNRDAIQAAAGAAREMFIEEVKAGGKMPEVTKKHEARIEKLRQEAYRLGLTKSETDKLIKTYGEIDPSITTKYSTSNFSKVFEEAQKLRFAQTMLELGITDPKEAEGLWNRQNGGYPSGSGYLLPKRATGGPITGPGTGTSDDVLMWGSNGEHVITAQEVAAAGGHEAIYQWRRLLLAGGEQPPAYARGGEVRKEGLPGYAKGGAVAPFIVELGGTKLPSMAQAEDAVRDRMGSGGGGALGSAAGGRGWQWQIAVLRAAFPGLALYSGSRPGARTSSGNVSWHARDRAVDVPPRMDVFQFIRRTYGAKTQELIWGGAPDQNLRHGQPHRYSDSLLRAHGPYKGSPGPSPHVHWAFDEGGWLNPGMQGVNLLKQPEPVLTPGQWSVMEDFVKQGMVGGSNGSTYQFEFRDTTLDQQTLRDMQARDDALARVGRPY